MDYKSFSKLHASEKVILATVEANTQFKIWENEGVYYSRSVEYFVVKCAADGVALSKAASLDDLIAGSFFYSPKEGKLYVKSDYSESEFVCTYKFFFASTPQKLPYDLDSGEVVEWDARIIKTGSLGQQLDDENTGIVMESSSTLDLMNQDGFFDDLFDTLIWENRAIEFFSWSPMLPIKESRILFSGIIESKSFDSAKISFKTKDFIYQLKADLKLGLFSEADGNVLPTLIGKPKRRIYGKAKNVQLASLDCILNGFQLTGTISVNADSVTLDGDGTQFLKELSPGDSITAFLQDGTEVEFSIESIESNISATIDKESDFNILNGVFTNKPERPWRFKNR